MWVSSQIENSWEYPTKQWQRPTERFKTFFHFFFELKNSILFITNISEVIVRGTTAATELGLRRQFMSSEGETTSEPAASHSAEPRARLHWAHEKPQPEHLHTPWNNYPLQWSQKILFLPGDLIRRHGINVQRKKCGPTSYWVADCKSTKVDWHWALNPGGGHDRPQILSLAQPCLYPQRYNHCTLTPFEELTLSYCQAEKHPWWNRSCILRNYCLSISCVLPGRLRVAKICRNLTFITELGANSGRIMRKRSPPVWKVS